MPGKSKIIYDPSLTLKQNAQKNNVTIDAIKYYVKTRGIDREGDRQAHVIAIIKEARAANPKASKSELSRVTGLGMHSITKYLPIVDGTGETDFKRPRRQVKPLVWKEDIPGPAKQKHLLMSRRLENISVVFKDADKQNIARLRDFLLKAPGKPMLFIGNGGMLDHFAGLLYEMNSGIARCITPLELAAMSDMTIKGCKCLLLSAGGGNMDIKYAASRLLEINPENTACITYYLGDAFKGFDPKKVFLFKTPRYEKSFISVEGKFYRDALVYRAFTGNKAGDIITSTPAYQYQLNKSAATLTPLKRIRHFVVLFSDYGEPAAHDFEGVIVETGIASAQVCDYRNHCHGRFLFVGNHTRHKTKKHTLTDSDVAAVLLITPRNKKLVNDIREKALAAETPIVIIETPYNDARAALDLLVKANIFLADYEEKGLGINPCDPENYNAKAIDKRIPKNGVRFAQELANNKQLQYEEPRAIGELGDTIRKMEEEERQNSTSLQLYPAPTIETITRNEEYDASKYLCYAFRKKPDKRKGVWIPFGNMNGGFGFELCGIHFHTSESAYICGMFSNNSPKHIDIQKQLIKETNGKIAKGDIRVHNESIARKDWYDFNVQWMLYVVWQKVCNNKEFRDLLLAVPDGATIIEDTSFHGISKTNDTTQFWGARNEERKAYRKKIEQYIGQTEPSLTAAGAGRKVDNAFYNFTDYGTYKGCNVMGKILTICRNCYKEGTEPHIDYDLLRSKKIHLLGKKMDFAPNLMVLY